MKEYEVFYAASNTDVQACLAKRAVQGYEFKTVLYLPETTTTFPDDIRSTTPVKMVAVIMEREVEES